MANALFSAYRNKILQAGINLTSLTISACFVDHADDTPVVATDAFVSDLVAAALVPAYASGPELTSKTAGSVGTGVFDATDTVFTSLTGDVAESLVVFNDTGTTTTSDLLGYWDSFTSMTPNGGNVTVVWNASGIWQY
jgi:hypothetical protein